MGPPRGVGVPLWVILCCCLLLLRLCAASPGLQRCNSVTCVLNNRAFCPEGSTKCGPCIANYKESGGPRCIPVSAKIEDNPDYNIDYLAEKLKEKNQQPLNYAEEVNTPSNPPAPPNPAATGPSSRNAGPGSPKTTSRKPSGDALLLGVVVACAVAGLLALMVAGICCCRMRKEIKLAEKTDYSAYRESPPPPYEKTSPGDKKLAQNAQMYHYQHQKQQMISMEKNKDDLKHPDSAVTSDEENEDGDFTVYECPGLAPTGEMEVKNPLFDDSSLHNSAHHPH